jgi:SAM-dependent methyltransferase
VSAGAAGALRSPVTGAPLVPGGAHAVRDEDGRWPVVDGIPYLRAGREALREQALSALDDGDVDAARVMLLRDQDDWAPTPAPEGAAVASVVAERPSLRDAMARLGFGPVADYFAHRWSDPTFLSGLALVGAHRAPGARVFELACGIGQLLRAVSRTGAGTAGADVVWAKLWLARRYVVPEAALVCFDAAAPWPAAAGAADVAVCHDALYFMVAKAHVARELERVAPVVLVGHAHNALVDNFSAGEPLDPAGYAALFTGPVACYDDAELTRALLEDRAPRAASPAALAGAAAVALARGAAAAVRPDPAVALPPAGAALRRNPLLRENGTVAWPSARYEAEYAPLSGYLTDAAADPVRARRLVDLPEAW